MSKELLLSAERAIAEKDWPKAILLLKEILLLDPENVSVHHHLALIYDKQNSDQQALQHYYVALKITPEDPQLHYHLGTFFLKREQWNYALIQFKNCVSLDEDFFAARLQLANLYLQQDEIAQAKEQYQILLDKETIHADIYSNLGVIAIKEQQPKKAIDYFVQALAEDEQHMTSRNNLAATYLQYDYFENAITHYEILLKKLPQDIEAHYNIGVAFLSLGKIAEAQIHFETVLKYDERHAASYANLGAIYFKQDERQKALEHYEKSLRYEPFNENIQFIVASIKGQQNFQAAPKDYLSTLFDNYAEKYEQHIYSLNYQAPELIRERIKHYLAPTPHSLDILDLGCGTGLMGDVIYDLAKKLVGVDLSKKMLKKAEQKNIYQTLIHQSMEDFFQQTSDQFDLMIAADVFCYIGDLEKLLHACHQHLRQKSYLVFTLECGTQMPYQLTESGRFTHHPDYLKNLCQQLDFKLIGCEALSYRSQEDEPVAGLLLIMEKF